MIEEESLNVALTTDVKSLRDEKVPGQIDYIEAASYDQFFRGWLLTNRPCLFGPELTQSWRSRREWVDGDGKPNFEFLRANFGGVKVPVADCKAKKYDAQPKKDLLLSDYLDYWLKYKDEPRDGEMDCLYLKDWHFTRAFPNYQAYQTPDYFSSDWLNEFWDSSREGDLDDYRFVYMGPKGSWTPFHADVLRSHSWSANICGVKKWILVPPGQERLLADQHGNLPYDLTQVVTEGVVSCLEVIQRPGEIIFVPSGWHHQVFNLEDTISINHNWVNGCSIDISWSFLQQELKLVQTAIADCREMEGWQNQCQIILRANIGMSYADFFHFLFTIAKHRIDLLNPPKKEMPPHSEDTGGSPAPMFTNHAIFDLKRIRAVLQSLLDNAEFTQLDYDLLKIEPRQLLMEIERYI